LTNRKYSSIIIGGIVPVYTNISFRRNKK